MARGEKKLNKIVVVGSLNMDFVIEVKEMPRPGETVLGKHISLVPGGKGANQAYAIAKMEREVTMIGAVGDDLFGKQLIKNLQDVCVSTKGIQIKQGEASGQAFIHVNEAGENSITVIQGANQKLDKAWIDANRTLIEACDVVVMQLEIPLEIVRYVVQLAKKQGKCVILDPAPAIPGLDENILAYVDILKPNETELATLTNRSIQTEEECVLAARTLIEKGVGKVLVTLGEKGSVLITAEEVKHFAAMPVNVVDTTAAGDSFTAGFVAALEEAHEEEAIAFATRVSALTVTRKGAQTSIPTLEEVNEFK